MSKRKAQEELETLNGHMPPNTEPVSASLNRSTPPATPVEGNGKPGNAWSTPGSAYDFRSTYHHSFSMHQLQGEEEAN
jgi:hypothetical protein